MDAKATEFVTVEIPAGSSNREIGTILEKKGLIKNGQFFNYYTKFKNYGNFQSGYFNLQKSMVLDTIIQKLQEQGTKTPEPPVLGKLPFLRATRLIKSRKWFPWMRAPNLVPRLRIRKKNS